MDSFLIYLAKKAKWDRLLPFPNSFRITTSPGSDHTKEEYDSFIKALLAETKEAIDYVTNVEIGIVLHNTQSIHPNIEEYEFRYDTIDDFRKNLKYKERWYLFHGSPVGNWHSILRTGIKNMSGTRFMTTGQVYGPGVYATDDLRVASSYGSGQSSNSVSYVAVLEILAEPSQFKKTNGIYVISDDKLLFPRYLFQIKKSINASGGDVLAFYKKLRDGLIKPKTKIKRLNADKKMLDAYFIEDLTEYCWSIVINTVLFRCYVYNYPFTKPILQLVYKINPEVIDKQSDQKFDYPFDSLGCYMSGLDWSPQNCVLDMINDLKNKVNMNSLEQAMEQTTGKSIEQYCKLED